MSSGGGGGQQTPDQKILKLEAELKDLQTKAQAWVQANSGLKTANQKFNTRHQNDQKRISDLEAELKAAKAGAQTPVPTKSWWQQDQEQQIERVNTIAAFRARWFDSL